MKKYLGVKIIQAEPMTLAEYNDKFNRVVPATSGEDGYLVQYEDSYKSWSPKDVFEKAYKEIGDFKQAKQIDVFHNGVWEFSTQDNYQGDCCDDCCESIN